MTKTSSLSSYQKEFIQFLLESEVLTFGDFVTKSGRRTPYFVNSGMFNTGYRIGKLGEFYAAHIQKIGLSDVQAVFGPAYKGIPLCVATSEALYRKFSHDVGYTFDRKEAKSHGDKGQMVGYKLREGDSVLLVEDVITAGTTLRHIVPILRSDLKVSIRGVIVAVDRCEKGQGELSASREAEKELGIHVYPIVTVHEILSYLSSENDTSFRLSEELQARMESYLAEYGA
ncbi:MAG: orotate phosphoribosyltransferase [Bdellovibrionales bacterium]|nr:orotate phosphoribosyltransferase [Bdellovibrionales bacterium]